MIALLALLALLLGLVCGALAMRWYLRRPRKVLIEERTSGLARYQAYKAGR